MPRRLPACLLIFALCPQTWAGEWAASVYWGKYTDDSLRYDILPNKEIRFEQSWLATAALSRTLAQPSPSYQWEVEGQLTKHWGIQDNWEANLLAIYRWRKFPWSRFMRTTAAIGNGISIASEVPSIENQSTYTGSSQVLNYLLLETTFGAPAANWDFTLRIHHRSGIMGAVNNVIGGSNVVGVGLRFAL